MSLHGVCGVDGALVTLVDARVLMVSLGSPGFKVYVGRKKKRQKLAGLGIG